ncbi:MAG: hypothetical protein A2521_03735 [Deltaproteobacteria bacterium RIFOXYD12_FULL_57_12]|nr:MAG: hypothetical protein A2521_03735 [Deltaproteobacteria bacterium RIFOXYD12_FULL_57_12]
MSIACTDGLASHIVDSRFFGASYATDEARRVFCDLRRLQRWLDVEVALAECQAELGMIPAAAAAELAACARLPNLDLAEIRRDIARTCHSLLPLLDAWQRVASPAAGRFIHFGATTQDIEDTAQCLEIRDVIAIVRRDLRSIAAELIRIVEQHGSLVMIGRTHGQHALPTLFGLKAATWLDELLRNMSRLEACADQTLVSQLFGGVGTMDAFGPGGLELLRRFSHRLGLAEPLVGWHSSRDRLAELLATMAILAGGLARIANEIYQLARNEIHELEEPFHAGKIGSSTMPHKRNPELCEQVVVLARLIKANAGLGFDGLISEHERDYRAVRLEWVSVTDSSLFLCAATGMMKTILVDLRVRGDAMLQNVQESANLLSTEALMFLIGEKIGKQAAHQLLYEVSMQAHDTNTKNSLLDLLLADDRVMAHFSADELLKAIDPASHVGLATTLATRVVAAGRRQLAEGPAAPEVPAPCPLANAQGKCDLQDRRLA